MAIIHGTNGNDNLLNGLEGDDSLTSLHDLVQLNGDAGNDALRVVGADQNVVNGGDGNDMLEVHGEDSGADEDPDDNILNGGAGNDSLFVSFSNNSGNVLNGGDGDDILHIRYTDLDTLSGGAGNDVFRLDATRSGHTITDFERSGPGNPAGSFEDVLDLQVCLAA
jgi:Ca2+-binding RTX toxin-like protein